MYAYMGLSTDAVVTFAYLAVAGCIVWPPAEFVSLGLTVSTVYGSWLGSEQLDFVGYHIRRTAATVAIHCAIPLGYFLSLIIFGDNVNAYVGSTWFAIGISLSLCLFVTGLLIARNWVFSEKHPVIKHLGTYGRNWRHIAAEINTEMLRIDKFSTGSHSRRFIITDSWLLLTEAYNLQIARKIDVKISVAAARDVSLHPDVDANLAGFQFLDIDVLDANSSVTKRLFRIRLSSLEFEEVRTRINSPLIMIRDEIVIRKSLHEQFVAAFLEQIAANPPYRPTDLIESEMCAVCMQKRANAKIVQLCGGESIEGQQKCEPCSCRRPLFCADCLGKWFASRQDQMEPDRWMSGKCPCPICRSVFCILDVCLVNSRP